MGPLLFTIWGTGLRKTVTSICTMIAAIAGVIVAIPPAYTALGLPQVAMRSYVDPKFEHYDIAQADTTRALYQLQLQNLEGSLYSAQKDQTTSPSQTVDQRIQELQQQIQQTQQKLNTAPPK